MKDIVLLDELKNGFAGFLTLMVHSNLNFDGSRYHNTSVLGWVISGKKGDGFS